MKARVLASAVEMEVFSALSGQPKSLEQLSRELGLDSRGASDFLEALVALGFLRRTGEHYENAPESEFYLVKGKEPFMGPLLETLTGRIAPAWESLSSSLRTGRCHHPGELFGTILEKQGRRFFQAMTNVSFEGNRYIARKLSLPWQEYQVVVDVGAAEGDLVAELARHHPHLKVFGFDLPIVQPWLEENLKAKRIDAGRVGFVGGDFLKDPLPGADVFTFGHVLHDWGVEEKRLLIAKALAALPPGGAIVVYESFIDEEKPERIWPLLFSLNMLVNTPKGFELSVQECTTLLREAGFDNVRVEHINERESVVLAFKSEGEQ
jgi:hypothetical protein